MKMTTPSNTETKSDGAISLLPYMSSQPGAYFHSYFLQAVSARGALLVFTEGVLQCEQDEGCNNLSAVLILSLIRP
jgi:hypothetical protein